MKSIGIDILKKVVILALVAAVTLTLMGCTKEDVSPSGGGSGTIIDLKEEPTVFCSLTMTVTGFENLEGQLLAAIFDSEDGFENDIAFVPFEVIINSEVMTLTTDSLPVGIYGAAFIHDEDMNGELNTNFIGIPNESFGFSNNPSIGFSAPGWDDIQFQVTGDTAIDIELIDF